MNIMAKCYTNVYQTLKSKLCGQFHKYNIPNVIHLKTIVDEFVQECKLYDMLDNIHNEY